MPRSTLFVMVLAAGFPAAAHADVIRLLDDHLTMHVAVRLSPDGGPVREQSSAVKTSAFPEGQFEPQFLVERLRSDFQFVDAGAGILLEDFGFRLETFGLTSDGCPLEECQHSSEAALEWRFKVDGVATHLSLDTDTDGLANYVDALLFDETMGRAVAELHEVSTGDEGVSLLLRDSHIYRLALTKGTRTAGGDPAGSAFVRFHTEEGSLVNVAPVPEPMTLTILGTSVAAFAVRRRHRRRR